MDKPMQETVDKPMLENVGKTEQETHDPVHLYVLQVREENQEYVKKNKLAETG